MWMNIRETLSRWGWQVAGKKVAVVVGGFAVGKVVAFLSSDMVQGILAKLSSYGVNVTLDPDKVNASLTALVLMGVVMLDDFMKLHKDTKEGTGDKPIQ